MEARAEGTSVERRFGSLYLGSAIACFVVLGGLTGRHAGTGVVLPLLFAVGCAFHGAIGLALLGLLLGGLNPKVRREQGLAGIFVAMGRGFLMMVPFTVLAAMAEIYLGWSAVQAFTSSGMMMAGAAVGVEMAKLGGGRITSMVVPVGGAFVLSAAWLFASAMAQGIGRG